MGGKSKIPAPKRHFGVKDPLKQIEVREKKIKNIINNPPKKKDFQPTSRSFKKFQELKNKVVEGSFDDTFEAAKRKEREKNNAVNDIKQRNNESDIDYLFRAQRLAQQKAEAAAYAAKYNVDIVTDPNTGRTSLKKRRNDEISELMNKNKARHWVRGRRAKMPKRSKTDPPKLGGIQKLKLKKQYKKDLKMEKILEKKVEFDTDEIAFNERVDCPPDITTLPRLATKTDTVPRPGAKQSLLLHSVLGNKTETTVSTGKSKIKKHVSPASKIFVEKERESIVAAYRQMKKNRQTVA